MKTRELYSKIHQYKPKNNIEEVARNQILNQILKMPCNEDSTIRDDKIDLIFKELAGFRDYSPEFNSTVYRIRKEVGLYNNEEDYYCQSFIDNLKIIIQKYHYYSTKDLLRIANRLKEIYPNIDDNRIIDSIKYHFNSCL